MNTYKTIVCIEDAEKFSSFLTVVKNTHERVMLLPDMSALQKELIYDTKTVNAIFIDSKLLDRIPKGLSALLKSENNLCIALFDKHIDTYVRESFIYDALECKDIYNITSFLIRLERDVNRQMQVQALQNEVTKFYDIGKRLSSEKDVKTLLELIIKYCMEMTTSDAATIYAVIDSDTNEWSYYEKNAKNKMLKFIIAKNNSVELNLESKISPILGDSIFGYTVIYGQPLRIDDVYCIPKDAGYQFNKGFDDLTGYTTKSILTIPMKDHQDRVLGVIQLINKKRGNTVIPFNTKDETVIFSLAGQAAVSIENSILYKNMEALLEQYRLTISEEVTKRRLADEEIYKLLSAVEHSPASVVITDVNGTIQYVNPKFTQLTGYTFNEAMGRKPAILNSGKHTREFYDCFWKTILSGEDWHGELYNKKKNGDLYWESSSVSSLKGEDGSIKYFISVKEDITEKKLIAQKLQAKNIELEETIIKLNEAQSQLIQKEKMAGIGQLAAGVAHEINNPLGFILSNNETLQKYIGTLKEDLLYYKDFLTSYKSLNNDDTNPKIEHIMNFEKKNKVDFILEDLPELFHDTNSGFKRVRDIVNALRSFSHIDQLNDFDEYDLNEGIRTTLLIAKSNMQYDINIHENLTNLPLISAIGGEINQVILNMILNAIHATKTKATYVEKLIELKTYNDENYVFLEIADNGIGIEKENLSRIFEPFYTSKPIGEGTGLGLSISYDIVVKKHKGEISVDSKLGEGTRFVIKLPIKKPEENL
ncbi:MAG: ATP-binding protein [Clostridia bacterium]